MNAIKNGEKTKTKQKNEYKTFGNFSLDTLMKKLLKYLLTKNL